MENNKLIIKDLYVSVNDTQILKGINLEVNPKEIHAIMGPNGNGKSTLLQTIMGHPFYKVDSGSIEFNGQDVLKLSTDERSRLGLFLAMQYPKEILGVTNSEFLKAAINSRREKPIKLFEFVKKLEGAVDTLQMKKDLAHRFVNDGFSGGEKKRNEILQMILLEPKLALLDEIDSGLDVDAIKIVSNAILEQVKNSNMGLMLVSHYERFFSILKPTHSHVLIDGKIVLSGDYELVKKIDEEGYDWIYSQYNIEKPNQKVNTRISLGSCGVKNNAKADN